MSSRRNASPFATIRVEGTMLPPEILQAVAAESKDLDGLKPTDFGLAPSERISEAVGRSWTRLTGLWAAFKNSLDQLPGTDQATGLTRDRWLLPLFQELGYGRLSQHRFEIEGKTYPVSHLWGQAPIHLLGANTKLDSRTRGVAGAATASPHSLVQELLNRDDEYLWAFLSNGRTLRVLRDNISLSRQAYVDFDLEAIFEGEVYADFRLLWMVCHSTRVETETRPEACWLEKWSQVGAERGTRALDTLRVGVEKAIEELGAGFLAHRANDRLREDLRAGNLAKDDYFREILRLVYRLLFLFVAEDRDVLLDPQASAEARQRYGEHYSTHRLRRLATRRRVGRHGDLWQGLTAVMGSLWQDGCPGLALTPLGSFLWSPEAIADLRGAHLENTALLKAVRALAWVQDGDSLRPVDYKNLGAEELGSVYESLLELHPELHLEAARFELKSAAGHERKITGSYYTPTSLINCLLDSALDPVMDERLAEARRVARGEWGAASGERRAGGRRHGSPLGSLMMSIQSYRDLEVWERAMALAEMAYKLTGPFPKEERYGMTSQIRRAAASVPANIAEGWGRRGTREFQQFLRVAQGSLRELETHLMLCARVDLCTQTAIRPLLDQATILGKQLLSLQRSLTRRQ